jgi:hypothetical protein
MADMQDGMEQSLPDTSVHHSSPLGEFPSGESLMQRLKALMWLAGWSCLALAGGCQTMGGRGASATGFSPSFGQSYAPKQSEPSVEEAATASTAASPASNATANSESADALGNDVSTAAAKNRSRWLPGNQNEPPRKALPVSSRTAAATDDDGLDLWFSPKNRGLSATLAMPATGS